MKKFKFMIMAVVLAAAVLLSAQAFGALTQTPVKKAQSAPNTAATGNVTRFAVEIEGIANAGTIQSISGLDSETEVVEYQDGEDRVLRKRPGRTKYANIVIKRNYLSSTSDPMYLWRKSVADGRVERKSGSVVIYNANNAEIGRYNFQHAWPSKWSGPVLDAGKGGPVMEEITLAVEMIQKVQ